MISDTFHSPPGVLFHLSLAVLYAIGRQLVFRLGEWSPRIQSAFHVFRPTWDTSELAILFAHAAFTLYGGAFQLLELKVASLYWSPATPESKPSGLG